MPFGIVAYALMLFSWTTFLETAVCTVSNDKTTVDLMVHVPMHIFKAKRRNGYAQFSHILPRAKSDP